MTSKDSFTIFAKAASCPRRDLLIIKLLTMNNEPIAPLRQESVDGSGNRMNNPAGRWEDRVVHDCSHVYSDGTLVFGLFEGKQERIAGLNLIAVTAFLSGVKVLMAQVMTTHVHIIVSGDYMARERFAKELKIKLSRLLNKKFPNSRGAISVSNDPIEGERELMNKIIYVYRNAIAAGWNGMPWRYVGGPGDIFFTDHDELSLEGVPLSDLQRRQIVQLFHTKKKLPDDWRTDERGLLLPHCWMDWKRVENLFRYSRVFIAFMHQSRDLEVSINESGIRSTVKNVQESELRAICRKMCLEMFGKTILSKASVEERLTIAKRIWSERLTYSVSALSRVTLLDKSLLESLFKSGM